MDAQNIAFATNARIVSSSTMQAEEVKNMCNERAND